MTYIMIFSGENIMIYIDENIKLFFCYLFTFRPYNVFLHLECINMKTFKLLVHQVIKIDLLTFTIYHMLWQ